MIPSLARMSTWYPAIEDITIPSIRIDAGDGFAADLAGAVLRALEYDLNPGAVLAIADELLHLHPQVWSGLLRGLREWGSVFVRADAASPKDACHLMAYRGSGLPGVEVVPGTQGNACIASTPVAAVALLVGSERVVRLGDPRILWARQPDYLEYEFRVFIHNRRAVLASWYYPEERPDNPGYAAELARERLAPLAEEAVARLGVADATVDVGLSGRSLDPVVVEVGPFPNPDDPFLVDPIMFRRDFWEALRRAERRGEVEGRI